MKNNISKGQAEINSVNFIDLFCGIGAFRIAFEKACKNTNVNSQCVFSSDIDIYCQKQYEDNFGELPKGDITKIKAKDIPNHDVLLAGFPCQPFSIIGNRRGFADMRGTLFFDIARIIEEKSPRAFVLENVKLLKGHDKGRTLSQILETLKGMGYSVDYKIFNALNFGLPQKRERIFIVGFKKSSSFEWPSESIPMKSLSEILESHVPKHFYASDKIFKKRLKFLKQKPSKKPMIWHENKAGHISAYPYSCALRAGASYNYLLVNGERRLTPREMFRLQGIPDSYNIIGNDSQARKQAGNSLPVPVAQAVIENVLESLQRDTKNYIPKYRSFEKQLILCEPVYTF
ncbi:MAG: DNA (cytosine-5-)-methyltransferase [Elusimicrobia bacterium RIFOXYB2_FULL_48_7]|nr:MAG: DNA (cytosine-5-)-methyltransferase [Elusimicrobia bacterium RIFOXYB2_FULL_48_7]